MNMKDVIEFLDSWIDDDDLDGDLEPEQREAIQWAIFYLDRFDKMVD
jgi:hypothetical protein